MTWEAVAVKIIIVTNCHLLPLPLWMLNFQMVNNNRAQVESESELLELFVTVLCDGLCNKSLSLSSQSHFWRVYFSTLVLMGLYYPGLLMSKVHALLTSTLWTENRFEEMLEDERRKNEELKEVNFLVSHMHHVPDMHAPCSRHACTVFLKRALQG